VVAVEVARATRRVALGESGVHRQKDLIDGDPAVTIEIF